MPRTRSLRGILQHAEKFRLQVDETTGRATVARSPRAVIVIPNRRISRGLVFSQYWNLVSQWPVEVMRLLMR